MKKSTKYSIADPTGAAAPTTTETNARKPGSCANAANTENTKKKMPKESLN